MKEILERKLKCAKEGQKEWRAITGTTRLAPNEVVILFPTNDNEVNLVGMRYLDTYLQRSGRRKAVILTNNDFVKNEVQKFSQNVKAVIEFDNDRINNLMALYQLYCFDNRFVVVALDEPFCRNASSLVGVKNTTVEQLIAVGVYSIIPFRPLKDNERIV